MKNLVIHISAFVRIGMELSSNEIWREKKLQLYGSCALMLHFFPKLYIRFVLIQFFFLLFIHTHTHNLFYLIWRIFFLYDDALSNENFLLSHGKFFFHALKINFHKIVDSWHSGQLFHPIIWQLIKPLISIHKHEMTDLTETKDNDEKNFILTENF